MYIDGQVGFALPYQTGGFIAGLGPTLTLFSDWSSQATMTVLAEVDAFRFNDGKCDPTGRLWTGRYHNVTHITLQGLLNENFERG